MFSLLETEQHGAEGLWSAALGKYCTKRETSEAVFSYGQTAKKACVGLARRRAVNLRGMARVTSQEAVDVQTSSEALVDLISHTSRLAG